MPNDDLTPEEKIAFESLPRERRPSDLLEARVVRDLKSRGLLRSGFRGGVTLTPVWMAIAAIAVMALIIGSYAMGQWTGSKQTERVMLAMHEHDNLRLAMEVQKSGTAYLSALAQLIHQAGDQDSETRNQGREVALTTLYAAAEEMVNLFPDDPVTGNILRAMDGTGSWRPGNTNGKELYRVAWF
ncbi:MAG: hypothetical protein KJ970_15700 [Candidatus Eisenbacteria bacterium]|uniref:Uncharacterized protein n=1 Tax=Eiseniibacteriota bacterium TaxID=2212470 RepID=A0A948S034_UNCEI|nr:hypothetical protein [Candidatus Eisenbacteria bacterium]MBU1948088.1 hypothetical protein [Candidatus Eisenbacteria bacterium]MBU2692367.1 hypothetical protein [Candidatus Eisenbacteria bacterium]